MKIMKTSKEKMIKVAITGLAALSATLSLFSGAGIKPAQADDCEFWYKSGWKAGWAKQINGGDLAYAQNQISAYEHDCYNKGYNRGLQANGNKLPHVCFGLNCPIAPPAPPMNQSFSSQNSDFGGGSVQEICEKRYPYRGQNTRWRVTEQRVNCILNSQ